MRNNKSLILILVVQIISIIIILLSYGIVYNNKYQTSSEEESDKEIFIQTNNANYERTADMSTIKEAFPEVLTECNNEIDSIHICSYGLLDSCLTTNEVDNVDDEQLESAIVEIYSTDSIEGEIYVFNSTLCAIRDYMEANELGLFYSEKEMNEGAKVCITSRELYELYREEITICGEDYRVIGRADSSMPVLFMKNSIYMPIESVPDKAQVNRIVVRFKRMLTKNEYEQIKDALCSLLIGVDYEVHDYVSIDVDTQATRKTIMIIGVLLASLSCVAIVLIYRYRIERKKPQMAVYFICGYTNLRVLMKMLKEIVACIVFSGIMGCFTFQYIIINVLKKYFIWFDVIFSHNETVVMTVIISIVTLVIVLIDLCIYFRKNPYEMWVGKRA